MFLHGRTLQYIDTINTYIYTHINIDTQNESVFVVSHLDSFSNNFYSCGCERCKQLHAIGEKLKV